MGEGKVKVRFSNIFDEYLKKKKERKVELDLLIDNKERKPVVRPESPFLPLLKVK